jgi:hypothetical protein
MWSEVNDRVQCIELCCSHSELTMNDQITQRVIHGMSKADLISSLPPSLVYGGITYPVRTMTWQNATRRADSPALAVLAMYWRVSVVVIPFDSHWSACGQPHLAVTT